MFCLFDLAWEKQQKRRQECKYLLELSKYKRGGWSIYPPDPVLQRMNVAPGLLISQLFLVALTSQTSSSSHGLAEGPQQSRESHTGHPWSEMLTARAESLDHEIVSLVWAETRGGPCSLKPIPEAFLLYLSCPLGLPVLQGRGCLLWLGAMPCP